ncbi:MAG: hypothetical protein JWN82_625 [Candidatus Saccharibacteria bacterium]|nr:hypothetical protein [Candidatus Saccharibacteria bacterium]
MRLEHQDGCANFYGFEVSSASIYARHSLAGGDFWLVRTRIEDATDADAMSVLREALAGAYEVGASRFSMRILDERVLIIAQAVLGESVDLQIPGAKPVAYVEIPLETAAAEY